MTDEIHHFEVGDFGCIAVSDGTFTYPDHSFFVNAPREHLQQALRDHGIQLGEITVPWTCLFVNTGKHQILVDTGVGAGSVPSAGKLLQNLRAEGIEPMDVDTVILTHAHPDHIGGNTDTEGRPAFPNARYVIWKDEWEFWMSGPDLAQLRVGEDIKQLMRRFAHENLPPIQGQVDTIDQQGEVAPGIEVISAPGHTPGHTVLAISSGGHELLYLSDMVLHPIHLEHPDWYPAFDFAAEEAMVTRRQVLDRVATEKMLVMASHFPFPGLGYIVRKREAWQWRPIDAAV